MNRTEMNLPELVRCVVDAHRQEPGPLLVVLQDIQDRLGYIDPDVVPLVAAELNLSRADVHGVVTFYRDFRSRPPGRTTVRVCRAEACRSVGAEDLLAGLEQTLGVRAGQTTPDGSVTLDQVFCLGNCALGPAAQVNGRLYGRLDRDRLAGMVQREAS
ncbi:NAD(P)H-dependent oxidoreductase subunit E [Streptomyces sp. V3I7]|uniref:NADH-quinone oxidoreductase subunit NuoE family protein n=1 Tax=Streptomyces sp. V3I7 TaxID=3042278 RepID=UPI0027852505|nr:NAD(P)H-dependent oxidoreductase subunit E [Streptomyces sp. V3I7]MDQ0994254.1 formate dehydrogenase subunit gamma [Streptomyces sp. V3I7]